eukprot:4290768-Pleurochrysis_carterae.AAC.2
MPGWTRALSETPISHLCRIRPNGRAAQVFEEYLVSQWAEIKLGPLPIGNDAIAIMRLVVQAHCA